MLQKLEEEYRARGLTLVTANRDDPDSRDEAIGVFVRTHGGSKAPLVVFPDNASAEAWHAAVLPTLYVLGRDGQIVAGHTGVQPEKKLREEIERALRAP